MGSRLASAQRKENNRRMSVPLAHVNLIRETATKTGL